MVELRSNFKTQTFHIKYLQRRLTQSKAEADELRKLRGVVQERDKNIENLNTTITQNEAALEGAARAHQEATDAAQATKDSKIRALSQNIQ